MKILRNIGIFDSGLGGLAILKDIIKVLPEYNYVYLGDNARVPYGGRSPEIIYQFTLQAVEFLFKQNCQLVILACNSATASALHRIQKQYLPKHYPDRKVLGVIRPAVEMAYEKKLHRVGVIGTYATINSQAFVHEFAKLNPKIKVFQNPSPLLVPVIEEGKLDWPGLNLLFQEYLDPLLAKRIEVLILGCTHYGLLEKEIKKYLGDIILIISQGKAVGLKLKDYIARHPEIETRLVKAKQRRFFVTDLNPRYQKLSKLFLDKDCRLKLCHLEKEL